MSNICNNNSSGTGKGCRIGLFCAATILFWFSMYTYVPFLTPYVESLGATYKMAGIIAGSYGFTQMLLRVPVGIMSDRFGKRRIFITFGMFFSIFSSLGLLLSRDTGIILIFRGLAGAAAATWVDFTILFSSYYKKEEASKAIGTISFFSAVGQMAGMYGGSLIAEKVGENGAFAAGLAAAIAGLALSFFLIEKVETDSARISFRGILEVASDKMLITVSVIAILSQILTFATAMGFTPVYAEKVLGAGRYQLGILTVLSTLPAAFASLFAGRYLAGKIGERAVIVTGFLLGGVFTIAVPFSGSIGMLAVMQVMSGLGRGLSFTLLMSLSIKHMPLNKRATAMGFFQSIYGLGMFAGPVIMGILGDIAGLSQSFVILGTAGLAAAVYAYFVINRGIKAGTAEGKLQ